MSVDTISSAVSKIPSVDSSPPTKSLSNKSTLTNSTNNDDNFTTFLQLLTTQLKNQDPTTPLDTNQFTQQLVQFSQVEQSMNTNTNLETLISLTQSAQMNNAVSYLGKTAEVEGNIINLQQGKSSTFFYNLPSDADSVSITITDSAGTVVNTLEGSKLAGKHQVQWDGVDKAGKAVVPGNYKAVVTALDKDGVDIAPTVSTTGTVDGVFTEDGKVTLSVGGNDVTIDKILSVRN